MKTWVGALSTGEVAAVSGVSQNTVIREFDAGTLQGFRVPGSRFRRISPEQCRAWLESNGIPTDRLDAFLAHKRGAPAPGAVSLLELDNPD